MWKKKKTDEPLEIPTPQKPVPQTPDKQEEAEAVVTELPQLPARRIRGEDGKIYNLTTQNEAIQEILEAVRELLTRTEE